MNSRNRDFEHTGPNARATKSVLTGLLIGGAIGAVTMWLFAPRSGEETRADIRNKALELRDRTTETVKDTVSQAKSKAQEIRHTVSERAEELKERGKHIVNRQWDQVSETTEDAKKKVSQY